MFEGAQVRLALGRMLLSSALLACIVLCAGSRAASEVVESLAFERDSQLGSRADAGVRALVRVTASRTGDSADDPRAAGRPELDGQRHAAALVHAHPAIAAYPHGVRVAPPSAASASRYEHPGALPGRGPPDLPGEVLSELPLG